MGPGQDKNYPTSEREWFMGVTLRNDTPLDVVDAMVEHCWEGLVRVLGPGERSDYDELAPGDIEFRNHVVVWQAIS